LSLNVWTVCSEVSGEELIMGRLYSLHRHESLAELFF
jgi:hypothetical protein